MAAETAPTADIHIAKTIIRDLLGRVLVLERSYDDVHRPGGVDFPGGQIELSDDGITPETPKQAAIREAKQETGIVLPIEDIEVVAVTTDTRERDGAVFRRYLLFAQLALSGADVKVKLRPEEHGDMDWKLPEELPELFSETHWITGIEKALESGPLAA